METTFSDKEERADERKYALQIRIELSASWLV
jgi:hypothetical protein